MYFHFQSYIHILTTLLLEILPEISRCSANVRHFSLFQTSKQFLLPNWHVGQREQFKKATNVPISYSEYAFNTIALWSFPALFVRHLGLRFAHL